MRINKQNEVMLSSSLHATAAIRSLANRGITVRSVAIEGGRPLITVDYAPACRELKGEDFCIKHGVFGRRQRMHRADFQGCTIAWEHAA